MKKLILPLLFAGILCSCGSKRQAAQDRDVAVNGDTITVRVGSPVFQKLKTFKVDTTAYCASFSTSGVVRAMPSAYAEIASPFAGRIVKSYVSLGQRVAQGTPLFEISSPEFFETSKVYFQAKQQMSLARKTLQREQDLYDNKISAAKNVDEAEAAYQNALREYENSVAALKAYNINPATLAIGQPLTVTSPIAGEVVKNSLVLGQFLKDDAEAQVIVADLSKVWIVANVKERDLRLLNSVQEVSVELVALDEPVTGKVIHVSELLDPETRSVEVIIECDNAARRLKPNMYGTVSLTNASTKAVVVPDSAVLQRDSSKYVMVKLADGRFRRVAVETTPACAGRSVVLSGLREGDEIIGEGGFYLIDAK